MERTLIVSRGHLPLGLTGLPHRLFPRDRDHRVEAGPDGLEAIYERLCKFGGGDVPQPNQLTQSSNRQENGAIWHPQSTAR